MPEQKGHPNAAILIEIAKEAAVNPEFWKEFEIVDLTRWDNPDSAIYLYDAVLDGAQVRRKPRKIRIGNYDVPEPSKAWANSSYDNVVFVEFVEIDGAELMLKALQELLGKK